jgi:hypothetical protein
LKFYFFLLNIKIVMQVQTDAALAGRDGQHGNDGDDTGNREAGDGAATTEALEDATRDGAGDNYDPEV